MALSAVAIVLQAISGILVTLLYPRVSSPGEYANWSLTNAAVLTTVSFAYEHVRLAAIRFGSELNPMLTLSLVTNYIASAAICLISCALLLFWFRADIAPVHGILVLCYAATMGGVEIFSCFIRARGRNLHFLALAGLRASLTIPCCVLVIIYQGSSQAMLSAFYGPSAVIFIVIAIFIFCNFSRRAEAILADHAISIHNLTKSLWSHLSFAWPVVSANAIYALMFFEYRSMAFHIDSINVVKFLFISDLLQRILQTIAGFIGAVTVQHIMNAAHNPSKSKLPQVLSMLAKTLTALCVFLFPASVGFILVWRDLITFLTTWPAWAHPGFAVSALTLSYGVSALIQFWAHSWFMAQNKTHILLGGALMSAVPSTLVTFVNPTFFNLGLLATIQFLGLGASITFLIVAGGPSFMRSIPLKHLGKLAFATAFMAVVVGLTSVTMVDWAVAIRLMFSISAGFACFSIVLALLYLSNVRRFTKFAKTQISTGLLKH